MGFGTPAGAIKNAVLGAVALLKGRMETHQNAEECENILTGNRVGASARADRVAHCRATF